MGRRLGQSTFVVVMQGVNAQNVYGPWYNVDQPKHAAQLFAEADVDDYHTWDVRPLWRDGVGLGDVVASYRKNGRLARLDAEEARDVEHV